MHRRSGNDVDESELLALPEELPEEREAGAFTRYLPGATPETLRSIYRAPGGDVDDFAAASVPGDLYRVRTAPAPWPGAPAVRPRSVVPLRLLHERVPLHLLHEKARRGGAGGRTWCYRLADPEEAADPDEAGFLRSLAATKAAVADRVRGLPGAEGALAWDACIFAVAGDGLYLAVNRAAYGDPPPDVWVSRAGVSFAFAEGPVDRVWSVQREAEGGAEGVPRARIPTGGGKKRGRPPGGGRGRGRPAKRARVEPGYSSAAVARAGGRGATRGRGSGRGRGRGRGRARGSGRGRTSALS